MLGTRNLNTRHRWLLMSKVSNPRLTVNSSMLFDRKTVEVMKVIEDVDRACTCAEVDE